MQKLKRATALAVSLGMVVSMTACSGKAVKPGSEENGGAAAGAETSQNAGEARVRKKARALREARVQKKAVGRTALQRKTLP